MIHCGSAPDTAGEFTTVVELVGGVGKSFNDSLIQMESDLAAAGYADVYNARFTLRDGRYFCIGDAHAAAE